MRDPAEPKLQTVKASEARQRFSELINEVARKRARVVIEKSGIPVAVLVPAEDLAQLQRLEQERDRRFAALDRIGRAFQDVPLEELEAEVTRAIAAMREENRSKAVGRP